MSSLTPAPGEAGYWRSLAELAASPDRREALRPEFFPDADSPPDSPSRRRFLQVMGASVALAGASGCVGREHTFAPLGVNVPGQTPGTAKAYATAMELGGVAQGLLVSSVDGRPIKVEGNPDHPQNRGGSLPYTLASVLELYDPDRSRGVARYEGGRKLNQSWDDFAGYARMLVEETRRAGGKGFRVLAEASSSEALAGLCSRLLEAYPGAAWVEYEAVSRDTEREGTTLAFGQPLRVHHDLAKADIVACLDEDLLAVHPAAARYARDFAARRRPEDGPMNRLYAVEAAFTTTGAMADHRLALRSDRVGAFASKLEAEVRRRLDAGAEGEAPHGEGREEKVLLALASDLVAHKGRSVVAAGPRQPAAVHALAARLNTLLGNVGETVTYTADPRPDRPAYREAIAGLAAEIEANEVETLVVLGGNPAYDAPADLKFDRLIEKVRRTVHLGLYQDETARLCTWHVPKAHYLESWGDARSYDGTYSVVQPLIEPLHGGKTPLELVALLLGEEAADGQKIVREAFARVAGSEGDIEARWREALDLGLLAGSAAPSATVALKSDAAEAIPAGAGEGLELVFLADTKVYDGRFANSGWLQEVPDFITKLSWDNAAVFGVATAAKLGIVDGSLVRLTLNGRALVAAATVLPGQADGSVALALGYGRTAAGVVGGDQAQGVAPVGFDAYKLRASDALGFAAGLKVEPTGKTYELATTQDHHTIDPIGTRERELRLADLVREGTLAEYNEHADFAKGHHHLPELPLFDAPAMNVDHKWGMAIDLSKCVGCNACVVACQSENNIPVVGKEQVINGREMHWIRLDRYFKGEPEAPEVVHQPVPCMHCENAPCEQVCPVAATVHDDEGLNAMVYNRCVGTRYCSNNCPYKVRRFNFFDYHKALKEPENQVQTLVFNPEVTVRSRGVMEKCTYCTHRIQAVKIRAKNENREVGLDEVTPACAQACPSRAISFGDLNRRESAVSKDHANPRSYTMLDELNVRPRTAYLARIRNPHPALVQAEAAHEHHG